MRAKTLTVLICLLVFGFNSLSAQQAATTPVTLTVTDPTGARIPHLQIRVFLLPILHRKWKPTRKVSFPSI